jgi:hypothetical protein
VNSDHDAFDVTDRAEIREITRKPKESAAESGWRGR